MNDKSLRVLASIGLIVGGALGTAGTFAPSASLRGLAWGIDGVALVIACSVAHAPLLQDGPGDCGNGLSHFRHRRKSSCFRRGDGSGAEYPVFRWRCRAVGSGACIDQRPAYFPYGGAAARTCGGAPVRGDGLPYLRRRADYILVAAASFLCLSRRGRNVRGVDCDAIAGRCRGGSSVRVKLSRMDFYYGRHRTLLMVQGESAAIFELVLDFVFA